MARGLLGRGAVIRRRPPARHPGRAWAEVHRRHHLVPLHQRGNLPGAEADARGVRQQQHRHLCAGLPFAHGLRVGPDLRHQRGHAGFRQRRADGRGDRHRGQSDRRAPGLCLAPEEAPAGGGQADRDRPAPDRPGAVRACRGRPSPAAASRHQRGRRHGARPCHRDRRPDGRGVHPRPLRLGRVPGLRRFREGPAPQPRGERDADRRAGDRAARRRAAVRDGRQRGDLLRAGRDRAQPGVDHRDGDRQPRHADRQHRAARRGGEPAARPEQRSGIMRHGIVPARAARLSPRQERRRARDLRGRLGRADRPRTRPAHSEHAGRGGRGDVPRPLLPGRGHPAIGPRHQACQRGSGGDGLRHRPRPLPERDGELRACLPARIVLPGKGRHLHQRRAADQPGAQGDGAAQRDGGLGGHAGAGERHGRGLALHPPRPDHGGDRGHHAQLCRCDL